MQGLGKYMGDETGITDLIDVEVVYALPERQKLYRLQVEPGTTALQAAKISGVEGDFPGVDLAKTKMGIFGQALGTKGLKLPDQQVLSAGDRVEIYRPLIADPKEARRKRAAKLS